LNAYGIDTPHTVIPTGIDLHEFVGGSGARFRRAHGLDPARPALVTVSRLAQEKNIEFLLEAVRVRRKVHGIRPIGLGDAAAGRGHQDDRKARQ